MTGPLYLNEADVTALASPHAAVDAVERMFRSLAACTAQNIPRQRLSLPGMTLHSMSAADSSLGRAAWKQYTTTRSGALFHVGLYDQATGGLLALLAADRLGQLRTGAVSAVAARWLLYDRERRAALSRNSTDAALLADSVTRQPSRPQIDTLAVLGCGWQAESQIECLAALGGLNRVRVYARDAQRREQFAAAMQQRVGLQVIASRTAQTCAEGADVVVTITNSRTPVLEADWLSACRLLIAAGSNQRRHRELPTAAVNAASRIFVDDVEGVRHEAGDLLLAAEETPAENLWLRVAGLASLASSAEAAVTPTAHEATAREATPHDATAREGGQVDCRVQMAGDAARSSNSVYQGSAGWDLFKSVGMAAADLALASLLFDRAVETGHARALEL
jgi:alanine dehydrogenase